jgi:hypothetical protein
MATSIEGVYVLLRSRGVQQEQEAKPTGMLEVRFVGRFLKVRETPNGLVVSDDRTILLRPVLSLHIPTQQLLDPASHQSLICGAVSTLNLPRFSCCSHDHLVKGIASRASNLAAGPRGGFVGYIFLEGRVAISENCTVCRCIQKCGREVDREEWLCCGEER